MFINISRRTICFFILVIFFISCVFAIPFTFTSTPSCKYKIVIDAGHGGIDGGSVGGTTGKDENTINLEYAKCLKNIMEKYNIEIIMTRNNLNGLYNQFSDNKKLDDMEKRKEIVNKSHADLVLSIHMNSFSLKSSNGAQVFYKKDNEPSKVLANSIQSVFIQTLPNARTETLIGDYYMLNEFNIPSVIIECGYLSNPEEEALLLTEEYRNLVCCSIFLGVLKFFSQ